MIWDEYFYNMCKVVASKSPCLSRKIGAILVRDKSIVSTGYNGPPRGIPHCEVICPRQAKGYESGTHLEECPAQHAEENAVTNAARNGVSTLGCTLYLNTIIPCKNCFGTLINAGIKEIVVKKVEYYDIYTDFLASNSSIKIRRFDFNSFKF
jgi:dCMP deaminase